MNKKIEIAGVGFDPVSYQDAMTALEVFLKQDYKKHLIVTPNPEMLVHAQKDREFKEVLNAASLSVPDGIGVIWASYYLSLPKAKTSVREFARLMGSLFKVLLKSKKLYKVLPQRVTGVDLLYRIVEESQDKAYSIYLLGAAPGIAHTAAQRLLQKYPRAIFAGSFAGTPAKSHEDDLVQRINIARPDILFVAYGSPAQEEWIFRNIHKLETVKVAIGVGGAIDFAAGKAKRAPALFRNLGLEWLWRLVWEPRRIRRIWNATVVFVRMVFRLKNQA